MSRKPLKLYWAGAFSKPRSLYGSGYLTPAPPRYENIVALCGGTVVDIPLDPSGGFQPDIRTVRRRLTSRTRMIVVSSPCNPTGAVCSRETLSQLAALALKRDLLLFSDESYAPFLPDGARCLSIASLPGMQERTIVLRSLSIPLSLAGWPVGILALDRRLCPAVRKIHQYTAPGPPLFLQDALACSLNAPETLAAERVLVRAVQEGHARMRAGLGSLPGLTCPPAAGTFFLFADVSGTGLDGDDFADRLLNECRVACVPGSKLGGHCGSFVRFSCASRADRIREGLARMERFLSP